MKSTSLLKWKNCHGYGSSSITRICVRNNGFVLVVDQNIENIHISIYQIVSISRKWISKLSIQYIKKNQKLDDDILLYIHLSQ